MEEQRLENRLPFYNHISRVQFRSYLGLHNNGEPHIRLIDPSAVPHATDL